MGELSKFLSGNKSVFIILSLIAIIGFASANSYYSSQQKEDTPIIEQTSEGTIDVRPFNVDGINNTVTNVLNGNLEAPRAHDIIFDERFFARENGASLSGSDLEKNKIYVAYLSAALDVVDSHMYQYSDKQDKINKMNELKNKLL
jgi:hypothetical protein